MQPKIQFDYFLTTCKLITMKKTKKNLLSPQLDLLGVQFLRGKCYSYLHVLKKTPFQLRELLFNFSFKHRSIPFFVKGEFVNYKTFPLQLHSSIICVGTLSCFGLGIRTLSLHTGFFALLEHSYTLSVWRLRFPPRAVTCVERKASA